MAKKRRDKERDPSSLQRVAKFTGAALGIGFGAASLYRRGGADVLAATIKTGTTIADDLAGKKITASNLETVFKKRIGKDGKHYRNLVKDYRSNNNGKIKFNTKDTRNIFGYLTASKQSRSAAQGYKEAYIGKHLTELQASQRKLLKDNNINLNEKQAVKLNEIIRDAYYKTDKEDAVYSWVENGKEVIKVSDDFHKEGFNFLGDDVKKFKDQLMANVYNTRKRVDEDLTKLDSHKGTFADKMSKILEDPEIIAQRLGKRDKGLIANTNKIINEKLDFDVQRAISKDTRKATLGDLYEELRLGNTDGFDLKSIKGFVYDKDSNNKYSVTEDNLKDFMDLMKNNYDDLKDVYVGGGVRIREKTVDGKLVKEFYSTNEADEIIKDFMGKVADTMPGRLFKGIDIKQTYNAPLLNIHKEGDINMFLSKTLAHEREDRLKNTYINVGKKTFQVVGEGDYKDLVDISSQVGDVTTISLEHGSLSRMYKNMAGTDRFVPSAEENKFLKMFDIGQTGQPTLLTRAKAYIGKFKNEDWERNRLNNVISEMGATNDAVDIFNEELMFDDARKMELYKGIKVLDKALDSFTAANKISNDTLSAMLYATDENGERLLSNNSQAMLRMLIKGDIGNAIFSDEAYEGALSGGKDIISMLRALSSDTAEDGVVKTLRTHEFKNKRLSDLVGKITTNTESNLDLLNISSKQNKIPFVADLVSTDVNLIDDIMRREVIKEVLMSETGDNPDRLLDIIDALDLEKGQERNLKVLQNWAKVQEYTNVNTKSGLYGEVNEVTSNFMVNMHKYSSEYKNDMAYNFDLVAKDRFSIFDKGTFDNVAEQYSSDFGSYTTIKKSGLMTMLENLNDYEKFKAGAKEVGKELFAGRKNAEDISLLTFAPYFMVSRLNDGVEDLGIGLSHQNAGSTVDLIKNIALKRVLPIAGALTAYDYLDYEAENLLGTSITGAAANAIGNADMAMRKTLDATGLSSVLDWAKQPNVIAEYWTGSTDFQTAEERQEWYEDGYSPVRSGRFWSFGSSSEFRGGDIAYYQPNFVKRANSNWREIGIYGSAEDKWSHSLIPTLRHPFSTINYLLDPYWLEKKNMDTRPYPYTGKMFSEGTPWGAILNPTIGEIIKPVKMLPEIRERLGSGTIDAKQILHNINERIKNKNSADDDMLVANGTDIRNAVYTPYAYATPGETLAQIDGSNVTLQGVDYMNAAPEIKTDTFVPNHSAIGPLEGAIANVTGDITYGSYASSQSTKAGRFFNKMLSDTPQGQNVLQMLQTINADIKNKAATKPLGVSLPSQGGAYTYNNPVGNMLVSYSNYYEQQGSSMAKTTSIHEDFLNDAKHSMSQLSGIYGFLGDFMFGEQSYSMKLADAGQMSSFSRAFWDSNIGGLGGGFMEIARRFFPSEDRSRVAYNPLRNNMEQWLPERFLTGDAYASIPKGEMRLPGKGYEAIHELHPDMFGK